MDNVVSLKGYLTFNSNINNRGIFAKCAIGYSNYNGDAFERGSLIFLTNKDANTNNINMQNDIKMTINSDGNVGIGTSIINEKLVVYGNVIINNGYLLTTNLITSNLLTTNLITSNIIASNILTSNIIASNILTSNIIASNILTSNIIAYTLFASNISGAGSNITHIDINNITKGVLPVERGGTGKTILNDKQLIVGNGTSTPIQSQNLTWNNAESILVASNIVASTIAGVGSNITKLNAAYITDGTLSVQRGGTGVTTLNHFQLIVGNGTNVIQSQNLTWNDVNSILVASNIVARTIAGVGSNITHINAANITDGTLPVTRGGTGKSTLTTTQLLVGDGDNAIASYPDLKWNSSTNTLTATNISGNGSAITSLNVSNASTGTLSVTRGGTGKTSLNANQLIVGNGTSSPIQSQHLTWNNDECILVTSNIVASNIVATTLTGVGSNITKLNAAYITDGTLSVQRGGTGKTSLNVNELIVGSGTSPLIQSPYLTWNDVNSTLYAKKIETTSLDTAKISVGSGMDVGGILTTLNINVTEILKTSNVTTENLIISELTDKQLLVGGGTKNPIASYPGLKWNSSTNTLTATNISGNGSAITSLNVSNADTGTLSVGRGGTGKSTLTTTQLLVGDGDNAIISYPGLKWNSSTNTLTATNISGNGSAITSLNVSNADTGTLSVGRGGTGKSTLTTTQLLVGDGDNAIISYPGLKWNSSTNTLTATNISGNGSAITSLNVSNADTGTLSVGRGGTGKSTLTTTQLLVGDGDNAIISYPGLKWNSSTNTLTATNISGNGSAITSLNVSNADTGTLSVGRGGTGKSTLTTTQLLVGDGDNAIISYPGLKWNSSTNTLTATNISGNGSAITSLNVSNADTGTLSVGRGGTGKSTLTTTQLLVGDGDNAIISYPGLKWNSSTNTLTATNISGNGSAITSLNAANITDGTLSHLRLPIATSAALGAVKQGTNIDINVTTGSISVNLTNYKSDTTTIDGNLIVNSNLIVHGTETKLYTDVYTTERLEVNGNINIPTGSKYKIGGSNLAYSNIDGIPPVSSKWSNVTDGGNNIYYNLGNVGIGTNNSITNRLEVNGSINILNGSKYKIGGSNLAYSNIDGTPPASSKWTNATDEMKNIYYNLGNVGIGTITSITNKLEVNGSINILNGSINIPTSSKYKIGGYNLAFSNIDGILPIAGVGASGTLGAVKIDSKTLTIDAATGIISSAYWNNESYLIPGGGTASILTTFSTNGSFVGIGTTAAYNCLHLHRIGQDGVGARVYIYFTDNTTTSTTRDLERGVYIGKNDSNHAVIYNGETSGNILFYTNKTERMKISAAGKVTIGANVGQGTDPEPFQLNVTGDIGTTRDIIAYYSDERLKTITNHISDVLEDLNNINVFKYNCNDLAASYGYDKSKNEIGLSAQEIKKYYPEIVTLAPFDSIRNKETNKIISKSGENYLTLNYERLVPILLQAIKELNKKYKNLEEKYTKIENILNTR